MSLKEEVLSKVTIPMYFYNIIVPQMVDYYAGQTVDFDVRPVVCCPLHDEDTPSMRYYEETNTFFCFGCRRGGDVIELHRDFVERQTGTRPSFNDTIKFLYGFFIQNNPTVKATPVPSHTAGIAGQAVKEELSSNIELAQFYRYTGLLEQQLLMDKDLKLSVKEALWNSLDTVEILVSGNKVNAIEGMQYLKSKVYEVIK